MKFLKSDKISEYFQLLELYGDEYKDALFLDTSVNRLYIQGEPVDARVSVTESYGDDNLPRHSYVFTDDENKSYVLKESLFGTLDENNVAHLHNSETGEAFPHNDGLMTISEKFMLDGLCRVCGVTIDYTYWASVNHVKDRDNNRPDVMTDVDLYIEDGKFYYDYDEYEVVVTLPSGGTRTETFPAGKEEVPEELVRVATMKINRKAQNELQYHANWYMPDGTVIELDDNMKTAVKHGGIPAGTTVEYLEKMTTNQVLTEILFQKAIPLMVNDSSAYIYFDESYTHGKAYVEVGSKYPRPEQLRTEFIPTTYQQFIIEGDTRIKTGEPQILTEYVESKYTLIDYQHPWHGGHGPKPDPIYDIPSEEYSEHLGEYFVEAGDKSIYVAEVYYRGIANAVDSDGNETYIENGEVKYYGKYKQEPGEEPYHISSANALGFTGEEYTPTPIDLQKYTLQFSIIAAWKGFSNASKTSNKSIWSERYDNFEPFKGNDAKEPTNTLITEETSDIYLAWPAYTSEDEHFYVYIPANHEIESVGYANDFVADNFDIPCGYEYVGQETITIESDDVENPISGIFSYYEIEKAPVNTVVRVRVISSE